MTSPRHSPPYPEMIDDQDVKDVLMNGEGFFDDIRVVAI